VQRARDIFPGLPHVESPLFREVLEELDLTPVERQVATELHDRGFAVIDFPDERIHERIERIKERLAPQFDVDFSNPESRKTEGAILRVQDAWKFDEDVRAIATNNGVLALLSKLYGRKAFPFQTLNFPVGTQQHLHSDSIHFSSIPERFMCGVWLAMEDVHPDAGPLTYVPSSQKWPILSNAMIGRRGFGAHEEHAQVPFEAAWRALVQSSGLQQETFLAKKGQALIWAANLLHGGSIQNDPTLTRWSQVTHYYFEDCTYYTPAFSDEPLGALDVRTIVDVRTGDLRPNFYLGEPVPSEQPASAPLAAIARQARSRLNRDGLPADFDPETYYRLNPDVKAANMDAALHYKKHGRAEGRRYRIK
jgi:hypothetical protein